MIHIKDLDLLRAFVSREAVDFTPNKNAEWIDMMMEKIVGSVKKQNVWDLRLVSLGNSGVILRALTISVGSGDDVSPADDNYDFIFCNCGCIEDSNLVKSESGR